MKNSKFKIHLLLLTFYLVILVNSSFAQDDNGLVTPEEGYDISIKLFFDKQPTLNESVNVNYEISSQFQNIENVKIEFKLNDAKIFNKQISTKQIDILQPKINYQSYLPITLSHSGKYKLTAIVTGQINGEQYTDRYEYLYFTISQDTSKNKMGWPKPTVQENEDSPASKEYRKEIFKTDKDGYITVPAADKDGNEIEKKILATDFYKTINGLVTISGTYLFRNRENTQDVGFYHSYARLYNVATNTNLAFTYTDNTGNFTFPAVTNPGADQLRVRIYTVRYLSGGKGYGVCIYPACVDNAASSSANNDSTYYRGTVPFTVSDGNQDIGTYISSYNTTNNLRAHWIKNDMDNAYIHLVANSTIRGPFTAEWADDNTTHGNHYHLGLNIHFKADVGDGTSHTVLHELGHNVMNNAGTFPAGSDCPSPHYINRVSGVQCAWTEGWASTYTTFVTDAPLKCFPPSTTNCTDFEDSSSYTVCGASWDCGATADRVEGHVTGALWDIYDNDTDGFDVESFGRNEIYKILEDDTNNSFPSWWASWQNDNNSNLALNSLFQNAIEYGNDYDVATSTPGASTNTPTQNQPFTFTAQLNNNGQISSISTTIKIYRSSNSIISTGDSQIGTVNAGIIDPGASAGISKAVTIISNGTYWVGACFVDSLGFDSNPSNNCSSGKQVEVQPFDLIFKNDFE